MDRQCGYCFRGVSEDKLKRVQLKSYDPWGLVQWGYPIWACSNCRMHLRGVFRYWREESS